MLNLKPHKLETDKGTRIERVVKRDPYIRIGYAEEYKNAIGKLCYRCAAPIFLQGGHYYVESGEQLTELPEWAKSEIAKLSPEALLDAGFNKRGK